MSKKQKKALTVPIRSSLVKTVKRNVLNRKNNVAAGERLRVLVSLSYSFTSHRVPLYSNHNVYFFLSSKIKLQDDVSLLPTTSEQTPMTIHVGDDDEPEEESEEIKELVALSKKKQRGFFGRQTLDEGDQELIRELLAAPDFKLLIPTNCPITNRYYYIAEYIT